MSQYIPPKHDQDAFHCPYCGVYAHQRFHAINHGQSIWQDWRSSHCQRCSQFCVWLMDKMIYPVASLAPLPSPDMPYDVREDFVEAREIVNVSPRGAAALLRLSLQKLTIHLGEKGENLNSDIANLVKKGLPEKIQQALDAIRVIGNNAVHPGQIDLNDNQDTAITLFELINLIIEVMIAQPKRVASVYNNLPQSALDAINKRDGKN